MARPKKKPQERERDAALVLFLALNMILLAFFILLTAMSAPNETKEAELAIELRKAFQSFGGAFLSLGGQTSEQGLSRDQNPIADPEKVEALLGELTRFMEENEERKAISFEMASEGLTLHITEEFSFEPGSIELREEGLPLYNKIYDLILRTTNPVRIEGHTDNVAVRTPQISDNWELSTKRALAVFRFFTAPGDIPASRLAVVGHESNRPLASNLTEDGRRRNRRVSVVFVGTLTSVGEVPR